MKLLVLFFFGCVVLVPPAAAAESLQIQGVTGFLSEYELSASVSGQSSNGRAEELSGLLNVKHVGLCTHDGPNEMLGQLTIQFAGLSHRTTATLSFDGRECTYRGFLSESAIGAMTCTGNLNLPIRLWAK
jgi:hypothetical protein